MWLKAFRKCQTRKYTAACLHRCNIHMLPGAFIPHHLWNVNSWRCTDHLLRWRGQPRSMQTICSDEEDSLGLCRPFAQMKQTATVYADLLLRWSRQLRSMQTFCSDEIDSLFNCSNVTLTATFVWIVECSLHQTNNYDRVYDQLEQPISIQLYLHMIQLYTFLVLM